MFALQEASRPTHLAEIVRREPTHLGFCDAYGLGVGGVWIDPARTGHNMVWRHPWPTDIITDLVTSTNHQGTITNSDLELAALVIQEATLLVAVPTALMATPRSGYDNTPTVSWSTCEASTINQVVGYLLCIRSLHSRMFFLNPSVSYHPSQENCMADDASCLFYLSDTEFITHISIVHPQSHSSWQISFPPPELRSCMVSTLHRKPCNPALLKMRESRGYIGSGPTSMTPCW